MPDKEQRIFIRNLHKNGVSVEKIVAPSKYFRAYIYKILKLSDDELDLHVHNRGRKPIVSAKEDDKFVQSFNENLTATINDVLITLR